MREERERDLFERSRIFRASPTNYSSVDRWALCSHVDDPDVGHRLTKHRRHNEVWHEKVVVQAYTGIPLSRKGEKVEGRSQTPHGRRLTGVVSTGAYFHSGAARPPPLPPLEAATRQNTPGRRVARVNKIARPYTRAKSRIELARRREKQERRLENSRLSRNNEKEEEEEDPLVGIIMILKYRWGNGIRLIREDNFEEGVVKF